MPDGNIANWLSDYILMAMLAARQQVIQRVAKASPVSLVFRESPFLDAIDLLANSQNIADETIVTARKITFDLASSFTNNMRLGVIRDINSIVTKALDAGLGLGDFKDTLAAYVENIGLTSQKPWLVETAYRTITGIAYGAGDRAAYADPDVDEMIWGYEYIATNDQRTRPDHWALNGTILPKSSPFWSTHWPGAWDWNCRCTHQIILKDEAPDLKQPDMVYQVGKLIKQVGNGLDVNLDSLVNILQPAA